MSNTLLGCRTSGEPKPQSASKLRRTASCPELSTHCDVERPQFEVGSLLRLRVIRETNWSSRTCTVNAELLRCFQPSTMSPVMLVRLHYSEEDLDRLLILKLYDRRFAMHIREDNQVEWLHKLEQEFRKFTFTPTYEAMWKNLKALYMADECVEDLEDFEDLNIVHKEAPFITCAIVCIWPRLVAYVQLPEYYLSKHSSRAWSESSVAGPGRNFGDASLSACHKWQDVCDRAIGIVNRMMKRDILNRDVNVRNTLIWKNELAKGFGVMLIDFGGCSFRKHRESSRDWRERQAWEDEEGKIGGTMRRFGWTSAVSLVRESRALGSISNRM
ncbi:hypothetical protein BDV96DRAFT_575981 [Lophiotrema nucula]|uniref:Protein kinase domain-containing protein n=1 Tax=Lophiotrema nucula TaxID=690887 RepID=A0A6A5Z8W6_9PLEO|nr:hypothetical protein BDV96DRAFT_575981 [Lophiotrema nucula]